MRVVRRSLFTGLAAAALVPALGMAQPAPYQPVPRLREEVVPPPPPGRPMIWEPGHWHWNGGSYVWIGGHYVVPGRLHAHWVHGEWRLVRGAWAWVPGHWV